MFRKKKKPYRAWCRRWLGNVEILLCVCNQTKIILPSSTLAGGKCFVIISHKQTTVCFHVPLTWTMTSLLVPHQLSTLPHLPHLHDPLWYVIYNTYMASPRCQHSLTRTPQQRMKRARDVSASRARVRFFFLSIYTVLMFLNYVCVWSPYIAPNEDV